ncbi:MAG: DUF2273 domain-containing protein [Alicyclobacillus sp.]|nr:DUF2273 domain-containing protein [Alicyclobacillus sp.]
MAWLQALVQRVATLKRRWHGLMAGCLLWLFWLIFGFWWTLLLVALGGLGYVAGRFLEERLSWKEVVDKLLSEHFRD